MMTRLMPKTLAAGILAFVAILPSVAASAQDGTLFVEGNRVGVGDPTPDAPLDVNGFLLINPAGNATSAAQELTISNDEFVAIRLTDTSRAVSWDFANAASEFRISLLGTGVSEFRMKPDGDLIITGSLTTGTQTIPDFVFEPGYPLMPLTELGRFVTSQRHLPGIPSNEQVQASGGINVTEFQLKLLQKIEELTLYLLDQNSTIESQHRTIEDLRSKLSGIELRLQH